MKIKNNKKTRKYLTLLAALITLIAVASIASAITLFSSMNKTNMYLFNVGKNPKINLDVNLDGVIDQNDLNLVIGCFGQTGGPGWIAEDVNTDGSVNIIDVSMLNSAIYKYSKPLPNRGTTYVNVTPTLQYVQGSKTFSIIVHLDPGVPVIGVQIDLSFNASLVHVDNVTNANPGVWNFFQKGTINNSTGLLQGAAVAILGGTVSTPIDCFNITIISQSNDGTSPLTLQNVIVTDQNAQPITATINSGSVMVDTIAPSGSIIVNGGDAWTTSTGVSLSLTYSDGGSGVDQVRYSNDGVNYSGWEAAAGTKSWTLLSGDGSKTVYYQVRDVAGNVATFSDGIGLDTTNPTIASIVVTTSNPIDTDPIYGWENITCTVTDALSGVYQVYININSTQYLMQNTGSTYYYNTTLSSGNHSYYINATDNAGNTETSSTGLISIAPNWDVTMDGVCDVFDITKISIKWLQTGANGWIREDINNDGVVNIIDVSIISMHWGESWYT